jgi:hypothetical protein
VFTVRPGFDLAVWVRSRHTMSSNLSSSTDFFEAVFRVAPLTRTVVEGTQFFRRR